MENARKLIVILAIVSFLAGPELALGKGGGGGGKGGAMGGSRGGSGMSEQGMEKRMENKGAKGIEQGKGEGEEHSNLGGRSGKYALFILTAKQEMGIEGQR